MKRIKQIPTFNKPMLAWFKHGVVVLCACLPIFLLYYTSHSLPDKQAQSSSLDVLLETNQASFKAIEQGIALWEEGLFEQALKVFESPNINPDANQPLVSRYQYYGRSYLDDNLASVFAATSPLPDSCKQQVLFVTNDIRSIAQAELFRARFATDERLKSLSICVYELTWFDPDNLKCEQNWQNKGRLGCDLTRLAERIKSLQFTHLVIFAEKGKANVHNGIMFLDNEDTYDVFVHELAHFAGFVDEYPLSKNLAKRVCAGIDAPNLVFQQENEKAANRQHWQSISLNQQVSLSKSRTCDNHATQAYKASSDMTFMEYHDTANIPANYIRAWQVSLENQFELPPAHVNFAQAFEQQNKINEGQYWRKRYQTYLEKL